MIAVDASALLALLFREPGHERVAAALASAVASTVNMAEVLGRFARDGHDTGEVRKRLLGSEVEWVAFRTRQAEICAQLLPKTRELGLSLGDRACLSLGLLRKCPVLTADRAWLKLGSRGQS